MSKITVRPPNRGCRIAVVGLGCFYPGAKSPLQLWENILARRRQFREMPDVRLPNSEYYDPDPLVPNKTYQNKAAVIDGYSFDWSGKRIPRQTFESTDIVHWLALDTALQAIADASYGKDNIGKEKTGVILGNTLTGEFTRANQMLLRWPYVRKALRVSAKQKGLSRVAEELEGVMEQNYKSIFAPVTEDTLAGGLANTIAGRICNYLDLHGGGYIVDGACSSSLLAVITAANYLELGQMDMVIAGGVDVSLDTFELIGFAKTGALTPDEMRVYDKDGKGFLPGEGCGMVVLKRYEDAVRDKDQIYATLEGWGISSDGKGGITAPSAAGQSRALLRAYEKAQLNPLHLDFIEGHGTGTTVGDKVELEAISIALNKDQNIPERNCGVTSFKSIVGHTKAAAGIGAFIKTVMAVNRRILPPTAGLKESNTIFNDKAVSLYPILHGQIRDPETNITAGVSAMGFGGINSHVVLQSAGKPNQKLQSDLDEARLLLSDQSHECFLFSAVSDEELIHTLQKALDEVHGISYAEMADLACYQNSAVDFSKPLRAAIVADVPFEFSRKLTVLIEKLKNRKGNQQVALENNTIVAGFKKDAVKIGAVFPGQGSQKLNMSRKIAEQHDWLTAVLRSAEEIFVKEGADNIISAMHKQTDRAHDKQQISDWQQQLKQTDVAQPAITLASLLWYEYLIKLGIRIECVSGHSLGELMAFYAAGLLDFDTLLKFSVFRGKSMAENGSGSMASLQCPIGTVEKYLTEIHGYATIANINGPEQIVVSGDTAAIRDIIRLAQIDQINAIELPVSAAFHSQLVKEVGTAISGYNGLKVKGKRRKDITLISSTNGKEVIGNTDLNGYFAHQAVSRVDFTSTVHNLAGQCDAIIEIGPGKVLSGLVSAISEKVKAFPVEINADDGLSINVMVGNLFVMGCEIKVAELYNNRLIREFIPARDRLFLVNPLERPFPENNHQVAVQQPLEIEDVLGLNLADKGFGKYLKIRSNFIREMIDTDYKYFNGHSGELVSSADIPEEIITGKETVNTSESAHSDPQSSGIRELLYGKIESITGFSSEGFKDSMRLLDDFNLDSIKSGALLNGIARSLNVTGKLNAAELSNASLHDIVSKIEKVTGTPANTVIPAGQLETPDSSNDVTRTVFDLLAAKTGFSTESIKPDYRLLDDLNLDSIKAGAFVAELARKFNLSGKMGNSQLANAKVEDIIHNITNLIKNEVGSMQQAGKDYVTYWVNAYSVVLTEEPFIRENKLITSFWKNKSLVIVHHEDSRNYAADLCRHLNTHISKIITITGENLHQLSSFENSCLLVLLPVEPLNAESIKKTVALLAEVARNLSEIKFLGFLQFSDGRFLRDSAGQGQQQPGISAVSFAASIHHERPDIKVRVIETDRRLAADQATGLIMQEFTSDPVYDAAGYDLMLHRKKMKYDLLPAAVTQETRLPLNEEDVVIVTGGAKGITAECAISLAVKYGCRTALIGSSAFNDEIAATLSRYKKSNLTARYYSCDISDAESVREVLKAVQFDLGTITVVIHGAGRNIPRRAENVGFENAMDEISPKLLGAMHICEALDTNRLKFFTALTSIIGITGMPGNSWYAFSNESLDLYLREMSKKLHFKSRTIAYSVWDEVGMGARMGSNKVLADIGIGSISPSLGVEQFLHWFENDTNDQQVVVSSRMGTLDTWKVVKPELPVPGRYITEVINFEPGRELRTRTRLNRMTDLYLDDHNYNGSLLFPTVFGLEAMAQAACYLLGIDHPEGITFENVSLLKPIVVPPDGDMTIEIHATIMSGANISGDQVRIFAGISTEFSDFRSLHFSSEIIVHDHSNLVSRSIDQPSSPLKISAKSDLYSWLLFQGRRFQHIKHVLGLNSEEVLFTTKEQTQEPSEECFSLPVKAGLILGSPFLRDVLLQSVQLFLTDRKYLPVAIKRWEINKISKQPGSGLVLSSLNELFDEKGICNVEYIINNELIERIEGYEVKALESTAEYPRPEILADLQTHYQDALAQEFGNYASFLDHEITCKIYKHDDEFHHLDSSVRHDIEESVYQSVIAELPGKSTKPGTRIKRAKNGKPFIERSEMKISISHSRSVLLMTLGTNEQGCDIEFVEKRSEQEWNDLLENRYTQTLEQLSTVDENRHISATRIWCVREALIKSFGMVPLNIGIEKIHGNGVVFKIKTRDLDQLMILTFPVQLLPFNPVVVSMVVQLKEFEKTEEINLLEEPGFGAYYKKQTGRFSHSFLTTFKDCKGFFGKTHFTNYPDWMGNLRELVLAPIGTKLLKDLGSGQFGMVTNASDLQIFHEADTLNEVTGHLWITEKSDLENSFIDLHFDYIMKQPDSGKKIRLAECNLSTTWVSIEGRGIVKKSPIPAYFKSFLTEHITGLITTEPLPDNHPYPGIKDLGAIMYGNQEAVRPDFLLSEKVFQTGLSNGNTVGNLYYSNYYHWQAKVLEQYLYKLMPDNMTQNGRGGEFLTIESHVNHLQEAMPFEDIMVNMYLEKVHTNGLTCYFEYYSREGNHKRKLAYGANTVIWCKRSNEKSIPVAQQIPVEIASSILKLTSVR